MKGLDNAEAAKLAAQAAEAADAERRAAGAARANMLAQSHCSDTRDRRLAHAWVLVKAGARDVAKHLFVEVSTGRMYTPDACLYHGIEFAWNHKNYWMCVGMPEAHSDSRLHPAKAHFDWHDSAMWEPVMKEPPPLAPPADTAATGATSAASGHGGTTVASGAAEATGGTSTLDRQPSAGAALLATAPSAADGAGEDAVAASTAVTGTATTSSGTVGTGVGSGTRQAAAAGEHTTGGTGRESPSGVQPRNAVAWAMSATGLL